MKTITDLQNLLALADKAPTQMASSWEQTPLGDMGEYWPNAFSSACSPETIREIVQRLITAEAKEERNKQLIAGYKTLLEIAHDQKKSMTDLDAKLKELGL